MQSVRQAVLHHGDASFLVDLAVKAKDASPFSGSTRQTRLKTLRTR